MFFSVDYTYYNASVIILAKLPVRSITTTTCVVFIIEFEDLSI